MPRKKRAQIGREPIEQGNAESKTTGEDKTTSNKGGFKKPLSTRQFVLEHLAKIGKDYTANIHRAYKAELKRISEEQAGLDSEFPKHYKLPTYHSFQVQVWKLMQEGLIKCVEEEETEGLREQFRNFENKPLRRYLTLA